MSRAFVKDADENVDHVPDRPISPHPNLVTPRGLAAIDDALNRLRQQQAGVPPGDDTALARDVRYWSARRASAQVVATPPDPETVVFGCSVTMRRDDGREQTYQIVGEDEADPGSGTISYVSPVARALIGKTIGETARVGRSEIEIIAIR